MGENAQYVVLMVDKKLKYIPKTYLWNSVGINRNGIVNVLTIHKFSKDFNTKYRSEYRRKKGV